MYIWMNIDVKICETKSSAASCHRVCIEICKDEHIRWQCVHDMEFCEKFKYENVQILQTKSRGWFSRASAASVCCILRNVARPHFPWGKSSRPKWLISRISYEYWLCWFSFGFLCVFVYIGLYWLYFVCICLIGLYWFYWVYLWFHWFLLGLSCVYLFNWFILVLLSISLVLLVFICFLVCIRLIGLLRLSNVSASFAI